MTERGRILLIMYVDVTITSNDTRGIADLKNFLQGHFHTKYLDRLRYVLGIKVA